MGRRNSPRQVSEKKRKKYKICAKINKMFSSGLSVFRGLSKVIFRSSGKVPYFCPFFGQNYKMSTNLSENPKFDILPKFVPAVAPAVPCLTDRQTDRQTDKNDEANSFFLSFANAPKICPKILGNDRIPIVI